MTEPDCAAVPAPQDRVGRRLLLRLLDWMLLGALLGGLVGVTVGSRYLITSDYGRWSLSALLLGIHWAFEGARIGTILVLAWQVTRLTNVIAGVVAALLGGLVVWVVATSIYPPLSFLIVRSPESLLSSMRGGFLAAVGGVPQPAYQSLLLAVFASSISFLRQRSKAKPALGADPSSMEASEVPAS